MARYDTDFNLAEMGDYPLTLAGLDAALSGAGRSPLGALRMSEPTSIFTSTPSYGLDAQRWQTIAVGAGNGAAWSTAQRAVIMTLAAAGSVTRQTYQYIPYQPGRPVRILQTGPLGPHQAGVVDEWGFGDAADGLFWRRSDAGLSLVRRSSTSGAAVDVAYGAAQWNGGIAPPDVTHNHLYVIEFVWLGALIARWGFAQPSGAVEYLHTQVFAGALPISYMATATLPLRRTMSAAADPADPATMTQVCDAVESEGGWYTSPAYNFAACRETPIAIGAGVEVPVVGLRPAATFGGITNRVTYRTAKINLFAIGGSVRWCLRYYPPGIADPITAPNWNGPAGASISASLEGTALSLANSIVIDQGYAPASGPGTARGAAEDRVDMPFPLTLDAAGLNPAHLVLAASRAEAGTAASVIGGIVWEEVR